MSSRPKRKLRNCWKWSWLVTLPICVIWLYWGWSVQRGWSNFGLRYDPVPETFTLLDAGRDQWNHMLRRLRISMQLPKKLSGQASQSEQGQQLRTINLFSAESELARLDSNLPHSGFEYVKGMVWDGQEMLEAKLRYRGDFILHWGYPKKSLRVRTKRAKLFEGLRTFNLLVGKFPEQLNNYLGYRLAHEMGLLAPRVEMVKVAINGESRGLHIFCEQLDETTLRQNDCMPGDLYSGELLAKDRWTGISGAVFEHPNLWKKSSINNHYDEESRAPLEALTELLNNYSSEASHARLASLLDMETWGRFSAFESLAQTYHFDHTHNWRLFYDANRGRFVPIVWDPIAWAPHFLRPQQAVRLDIVTNRLHALLYQNGDFLRGRHEALRNFFESGMDKQFLDEVDRSLQTARHALKDDPNARPLDEELTVKRMGEFRESVRRTFSALKTVNLEQPSHLSFARLDSRGQAADQIASRFALEVTGREPIERLQLHFEQPIEQPLSASLRVYHGGQPSESSLTEPNLAELDVAEFDVSGALSVAGQRVELELGLVGCLNQVFMSKGITMKSYALEPGPAYYELTLHGLESNNRAYEVLAHARGRAPFPAQEEAQLPLRCMDLYRAVQPVPAYSPEVWQGEVFVDDVLEIPSDLTIQAGTTIQLAAGASIIVRGRLLAEGTLEAPIRFIPATVEQAPWGAFALQGKGTSGSRLSHCVFVRGSGLKRKMYEYSAMFSVHDSDAVVVNQCSFQDSQIVDDMVHAVYSEIELNGCRFERSLSDAIDLDICQATLRNCTFVDSGNDAIDLMTTEALIVNTRLARSGDKGISVGEGSSLLALNSVFERCAIGVQAKDSSRAMVLHSDFVANDLPVDAYKKNWRYNDGGHVQLLKCTLEKNKQPITADKNSSVALTDSFFDGLDQESEALRKQRLVFVDVDGEFKRKARAPHKLDTGDAYSALWARAAALTPLLDSRKRGARLE